MKTGVSTWSLLGLDLFSAVRSVGDAGFDYIELWGEVPHAYPDWVDKAKLRDALSSYSMELTTHAPFTDLNPAAAFQPVRTAVERTLEDFVRFSDYLGAAIVTVHPGSVHSESLVPRAAKNAVSTLRKMVRAAGGRVAVNVENQTKSGSNYHFPLASTAESLDLILADVEELGFTLDTGHAHVNGQDPLSVLERESARLTEVHLSDNLGASDDHLVPGQGNAPLKGVMERLAGADVLVCLELNPHRYSSEDALRAAVSFKSGV